MNEQTYNALRLRFEKEVRKRLDWWSKLRRKQEDEK
jgi:hypothetical protein